MGKAKIYLYWIALIVAILTLAFSYTGLGPNYDTEPILGLGILALAVAGLKK